MLKMVCAAVIVMLMSGCSFLDKQADKRLGDDCNNETRILRADLLTDMLEDQYGKDDVEELREDVALMVESHKVGASLDAAGDAYKYHFVGLVVDKLKIRTIQVVAGNFQKALDRLKDVPSVAAEVNRIEAAVLIACASGVGQR